MQPGLEHVSTCLVTATGTYLKSVLKETAEKNDVPEAQTLAQAGLLPEYEAGISSGQQIQLSSRCPLQAFLCWCKTSLHPKLFSSSRQ